MKVKPVAVAVMTVVGGSAVSLSAQAASLVPAGGIGTALTDTTDTVTAVVALAIPILVATRVGMAVIGWLGSAFSKAGVR